MVNFNGVLEVDAGVRSSHFNRSFSRLSSCSAARGVRLLTSRWMLFRGEQGPLLFALLFRGALGGGPIRGWRAVR